MKTSLIVWKVLRATFTTASRKTKRRFEKNVDWVTSSEAPVKWRTFNDYPVARSRDQVISKWEASLWDEDIVWSYMKV